MMFLSGTITLTLVAFCILTGVHSIEVTDVRLADGVGPNDGRVELNVNGVWGTVCDDRFDMKDAKVLCRMMGLPGSWYFPRAWYGAGTGPVFATRLDCSVHEAHIRECGFEAALHCEHSQDVSIICTDRNDVRLADGFGPNDGRVELNLGGVWGTVCDDRFDMKDAQVLCRMMGLPASWYFPRAWYGAGTGPVFATRLDCSGHEAHIRDCGFEAASHCEHSQDVSIICTDRTDVRLADGFGPNDGRVELNLGGVWGTVCDDRFDMKDAEVFCRMVGLSASWYFPRAWYGAGTGPVFASKLDCSGHESHIRDCRFESSPYCEHSQDVSIICTECGRITIVDGDIVSVSANGSELTVDCRFSNETVQSTCDNTGDWSLPIVLCDRLNITDIRLADGVGLFDGRVEILVDDMWGGICSSNKLFANEGNIICNMLGLSFHGFLDGKYFHSSSAVVHIYHFKCNPHIANINDCAYTRTQQRGSKFVAIQCEEYPLNVTDIRLVDGTSENVGRVELRYGDVWGTICIEDISYNGADTLCHMLELNVTKYFSSHGTLPILIGSLQCDNVYDHINHCPRYYQPYKRYCNTGNQLSLICTYCGLLDEDNGVIISANETVVTVKCDEDYRPKVYIAECSYNGTWVRNESCVEDGCGLLDEENGRIISTNGSAATVQCDEGYAPYIYIAECLYNGTWVRNESCIVYGYPLNITDIRLADGVGWYDGRVEVNVNGTGGTVCVSSFGSQEASVLCNIIFGLPYYQYTDDYYNAVMGPIFISKLDCNGAETDINQCKYIVNNSCSHSKDVAVICNGMPLNITDVRLVNGTDEDNGRVEVLVDGVWGTVCNQGITIHNADTWCKMLNLSLYTFYKTPLYHYGEGPVLVGDMVCPVRSSHIDQCRMNPPGRYKPVCTHDFDLSLSCTEKRPNITGVRVNGTAGPYHGRIEVEMNNTWGTLCRHALQFNAANTICRALGASRVRNLFKNARYGEGEGPVHISLLHCLGHEEDINDCLFIYDNDCEHKDDVSIECFGPYLNITDVRLANGTGQNDGRAEIKVGDTWGTICDRDFNMNDANAFCHMRGLKALHYITGATYGEGDGPVYIDTLYCSPGRSDIRQCPYIYQRACSHSRDVSLICSECGQTDIHYWDIGYFNFNGTTLYADCSYYKTYIGTLSMTCDKVTNRWRTKGRCKEYSYPLDISAIRLVGDNAADEGRIELKTMDTWGTVCSDGFGQNEADVICRMAGYLSAIRYFVSDTYTDRVGPIFVDDLQCEESVNHINNCTYVTLDNCTHENDVHVVCTDCGIPVPKNGKVNSTATNYATVVMVTCNEGYRIKGSSVITCQSDGQWSDVPTCKFIDCGDPTPDNGLLNTTSTNNGTVASISCQDGYHLVGDNITVCKENDSWTGTPKCLLVDCGDPDVVNVNVSLSQKTTYGEFAVITCLTGYLPTGSWLIQCLANRTWEQSKECELVDCGDPVPIQGFSNKIFSTGYGSVGEIYCNPGYNITGNSTIVCQEDGTWSGSPVCDTNDCGVPIIANSYTEREDKTIGSVAIVTCHPGYSRVGPATIECTAQGWSSPLPECTIQDCGDPTPYHGCVVGTYSTLYGDVVDIVCDIGYEIIGDSKIVCKEGGTWSSHTTCRLIDCGISSSPLNGSVVYGENTYYEAKVVFQCDEGYLLVGEDNAVCGNYSLWSNGPPVCEKLSALGTTCEGDEYCQTEGAACIDSVCSCMTGIYEDTVDKCDAMPLFPYGEEQSDSITPMKEPCMNTSFNIKVPVFDTTYTSARICRDGFICISEKGSKKATFPTGKKKVLAPFYANTNPDSGNVHYRTYNPVHYTSFNQHRKEVELIESLVVRFSKMEEFDVSFVLIVTWENMKADNDIQIDISKKVSFQLVVVSDGMSTFIFYIYGSGKMQWQAVKQNSVKINVWAGYNIPNTYHYDVPGSFTPAILDMDSYVTNGVSGLVFLQSPIIVNNDVQCVNWFKENVKKRRYNDLSASLMPACPCEIPLARWDPWFWRIQRWHNNTDYICVDMFPGRHYDPFGKSCCYDTKTRFWIDERPFSGSFYRYNKGYKQQHYLNDEKPKDWCCSGDGTHCDLFYKLRPTGNCYRETPYNMGAFWADPHYRTLDGKRFTFNGLGEYTLLQVRTHSIEFDLQARTERYRKTNGTLSDATIFAAFAATDDTGNSIHAEINIAKIGLNVYANKVDVTHEYNAANEYSDQTTIYTSEDNNLILTAGGSLNVFFSTSGISLNISVNVGMLLLTTFIPKSFRNQTTGLLGNFNGETFDDFILPNGTMLPDTLTEQEIFQYGQEWSIDPQYSAFVYPKGYSHTDYHNASHIPPFLQDVDDVTHNYAENVCDGSQYTECIFDMVFTKNETVALETYRISEQIELTVVEMMEEMPYLIGCATIYVSIHTEVVCEIFIDDEDDVYFLSNDVSAVYDGSSKTIKYFQSDAMPVYLRFAAVNTNGRSSVPFVVDILLCTGCNERGICIDIPRQDRRQTEHFKYAMCECFSQYTGLDCEEEYDWCSEQPCSLGRNCSTLTVAEQTQLSRFYLCEPCPSGYYENDDDQTCLDTDECNNVESCDHTCINTYGSYICTCDTGYQVDKRDSRLCKDIDECHDVDIPHTCSQQCQNIVGGFSCTCYNGYYFNSSTLDCEVDIYQDTNPCKDKDCLGAEGCTYDDIGNAACFCSQGYTLDFSRTTCIDKDECVENICSQGCENMIGSFQCVCYAGYRLDTYTNCIECDDSHWGDNCTNICSCHNLGSAQCHPVKGCICQNGWYGNVCDMNINECDVTWDICDDAMRECVDNIGSYRCECINGYTETLDGQCQDINECDNPMINDCDQTCINTHGSYSCECKTGYTEVDSKCTNIDECELNTHECEQVCEDHPGTYNCFCHIGYILNDDRRTCTEVTDTCLSMKNLTCSHFCIADVNNGVCGCQQGFKLGSDDVTCIDKNQCLNPRMNRCDKKATCKNTAQSYECICPPGTQLNNDGRTCAECDSSHFGVECQQSCNCLHGFCDNRIECLCDTGWVGMNCDIDVDECSSGVVTCTQEHTECVNTKGSAVCRCKAGFKDKDGTCIDIDECEDRSYTNCDQICTNIPGSYQCSCLSGFMSSDGSCNDINECNGLHDCEQFCENKAGSYSCYCEDGFHIDSDKRSSCIPNEFCNDLEVIECGEHATCYRLDGNPQCICEPGYTTISGVCTDIDECTNNICFHTCENSAGNFTCSCLLGYLLNGDNLSCKGCDNWTFGQNCESTCSCNITNTLTCDSTNGTCTCKHGWTDDTCNTDIDECIYVPGCTNYSTCMNSQGGYHCECDAGFIETAAGTCEECDKRYYGYNCEKECNCILYNTQSCDHVTGFCTCLEGWIGSRCHIDVNECELPETCVDKPRSKCDNEQGSYTCSCVKGYFEQDEECVDVDECLLNVHSCTELCYNTEGGHVCECYDGSDTCKYSGDDNFQDTLHIIIGITVGLVIMVTAAILVLFIKCQKPSQTLVEPLTFQKQKSAVSSRQIFVEGQENIMTLNNKVSGKDWNEKTTWKSPRRVIAWKR